MAESEDSSSEEEIGKLKPGDEIIIKKGYGYPVVEHDMTDIVVAVRGLSALTASGIRLSCLHGKGIKPTGKHFEKFELSPEAKQILARV